MVAVRIIHVRNISVSETVDIQGRSPNWVRNLLRRYDGGLKGLLILPRSGRLKRILWDALDEIMAKVAYCEIMSVDMQQRIRKETGVKLRITCVRSYHARGTPKYHAIRANPIGSAPCQSRGYSYASSPPSKPMNLARTSSDAAPGFPSLLEATTLRTSVMAPAIFWRAACISCCWASILW